MIEKHGAHVGLPSPFVSRSSVIRSAPPVCEWPKPWIQLTTMSLGRATGSAGPLGSTASTSPFGITYTERTLANPLA